MELYEAWPRTQHIHSEQQLPEAPTGQEQIVSHLAEWHHSGLLKLEFKYIISGNERGEEEKWPSTPFFLLHTPSLLSFFHTPCCCFPGQKTERETYAVSSQLSRVFSPLIIYYLSISIHYSHLSPE